MPAGTPDPNNLQALSEYGWQTLAYCARMASVPGYVCNPGVWRRLSREGLVEQAPGPRLAYQITPAGRAKLAARP